MKTQIEVYILLLALSLLSTCKEKENTEAKISKESSYSESSLNLFSMGLYSSTSDNKSNFGDRLISIKEGLKEVSGLIVFDGFYEISEPCDYGKVSTIQGKLYLLNNTQDLDWHRKRMGLHEKDNQGKFFYVSDTTKEYGYFYIERGFMEKARGDKALKVIMGDTTKSRKLIGYYKSIGMSPYRSVLPRGTLSDKTLEANSCNNKMKRLDMGKSGLFQVNAFSDSFSGDSPYEPNRHFEELRIALCVYEDKAYYEISSIYKKLYTRDYEYTQRLVSGKLYPLSMKNKKAKQYKKHVPTVKNGIWKTIYVSDTTEQHGYFYVQRFFDKEEIFRQDSIRIFTDKSQESSYYLKGIYKSLSNYPFRMLGKNLK